MTSSLLYTHTYTATVEGTTSSCHHVTNGAVDQATPIPSHIHLPAILVSILWGAWPIAKSLLYMLQWQMSNECGGDDISLVRMAAHVPSYPANHSSHPQQSALPQTSRPPALEFWARKIVSLAPRFRTRARGRSYGYRHRGTPPTWNSRGAVLPTWSQTTPHLVAGISRWLPYLSLERQPFSEVRLLLSFQPFGIEENNFLVGGTTGSS